VEGGSLQMTRSMADYFTALGGELRLGLKVDKVETRGNQAVGVHAGGAFIPADAVIVTADILGTGGRIFDPPLGDPWIGWIRRNAGLVVNTFFSLGLEVELPEGNEVTIFSVEPFEYAGKMIDELMVGNYTGFAGYAPPGCAALTVRIRSDSYDYWKQAKEDGCYEQKKEELYKTVLVRLEQQYPRIKGKVAVWDVATRPRACSPPAACPWPL